MEKDNGHTQKASEQNFKQTLFPCPDCGTMQRMGVDGATNQHLCFPASTPSAEWEKQFDEYVNEVRRDLPSALEPDNEDSPIRYFGYKTRRGNELFTVTDFGHIKAFIRTLLHTEKQSLLEEILAKKVCQEVFGRRVCSTTQQDILAIAAQHGIEITHREV